MKKLFTCIIVDDEPPAIRLLEKYVDKISFLKLEKTFTKPLEALAFLEHTTIDIAFLDIQMPGITGIQLSKIVNTRTRIIFTTAYPEFALESYNVAAIDYLLKPVEFERFYKAVKKVMSTETPSLPVSKEETNYLFLKTDGKNKFKKIFINEIYFLQSLKNYVAVQIENEQIITYSTLKYFEEKLSSKDFIQIHKSYLISIKHIDKVENDAVWIQNNQLPLGNTYKKHFFNTINEKN